MKAFLFAVVVGLLVVTSHVAHADANDNKAAELKRKGDSLLDAKRFEEALAAYEAAYALKANPALLYNRGRALQFLARYPEALAAVREFVKSASPELLARVAGLNELVADLEAHVATVTFDCKAPGARVLIAGREIGTCPFGKPMNLAAGHVKLEAIAVAYLPFAKEVDLPGGKAITVPIELKLRDTSGFVVIKSKIEGASASLDGRMLGVVPAESGPVAAGSHVVKVDHSGYDAASTTISLGQGERKEIDLDPTKSPALYTRWWFWTGIGVIVVGTVATVIVVTTEKSPPSGNFSPGTVTF